MTAKTQTRAAKTTAAQAVAKITPAGAAALTVVAAPAAPAAAPAAPADAPQHIGLTAQICASLRADGGAAYEGEGALKQFAAIFQPFMATATQQGDFVNYTEAARQWRIGYEQTRRNTPSDETIALTDRSQDAFERRVKSAASETQLGEGRLLGDKPKSVNAESLRKAQARAAAAEVIKNAISGKTLVELGKAAAYAKKEEEARVKAAMAAQEAAAKAAKAKDPLALAKATEKLEAARLAAEDAHKAAAQARTLAESKAVEVKKADVDAANKRVKEFRELARALIAEAGEAQLVAVCQMLEKAGVLTAAQKKAAADAAVTKVGIAPV